MTLGREKRNELRLPKFGTVYYKFSISSDELPGVTVDVSNSGAAIYTPHALNEGIQITIRGEGLWDGLKNATVKCVNKINKDIYRVGLSFN